MRRMQTNAHAMAATNPIRQQQVDEVADDLLSRGIRPTTVMVQKVLGGDRPALIFFLEDWARRLHRRVAGITNEELDQPADRASIEKADLELMREADSAQRNAVRLDRLQYKRNTPKASPDQRAVRRKALLGEIEKAEDQLRGAKQRVEAIMAALHTTETMVAAFESRLEGHVNELRSLSLQDVDSSK
jgi:hypothetical protein